MDVLSHSLLVGYWNECLFFQPLHYDYYGAYGFDIHKENKYYDRLKMDYTFDFPLHHDTVSLMIKFNNINNNNNCLCLIFKLSQTQYDCRYTMNLIASYYKAARQSTNHIIHLI